MRRLQEAANGWKPSGDKWWHKWTERLDTWVQDDLLRPTLKKEFEQVWSHWERKELLVAQANRGLVEVFIPALEQDEERCRKEKNERWDRFKESVAKGESVGFNIVKEKVQEGWAGNVSNVAQL